MNWRLVLALFAAMFCLRPALADVALPEVISDHMVLQAEMAAPIFGTAAPGESVTVEFNGRKKTATADKDGKWLVKFDPLKPGGPFELKVSGKNALTVKDVLVGEVWLASGQSNMRFPLSNATGGKEAIAASANPRIRYHRGAGKWLECGPQTAGGFSAVAYHFAVDLEQQRKVPVGIIENAVNGAVGQAFISPAALETDKELTGLLKAHGEATSEIFNRSFTRIIPYGIRGALWYQGEGNRDYPVTYRKLLTALIGDWRKQWGQGDFPFLIVQLANYQERRADPWEGKDCAMREAQLKVSQSVPNTALVVTIDLGIAKDVHYPNKKTLKTVVAYENAFATALKPPVGQSGRPWPSGLAHGPRGAGKGHPGRAAQPAVWPSQARLGRGHARH
jgi:sialate O-acetylesterase